MSKSDGRRPGARSPWREGRRACYDETQTAAECGVMASGANENTRGVTDGVTDGIIAQPELVAAAVAGDRLALERLLLAHYDALAGPIGARLPARLQATQAVEDI